MAALGMHFDANTVEPSSPNEIVPAGKYLANIVNSEMRGTKDGQGQYLWLEISILDGAYANRRLFDRLNLINHNAQASDIAQKTLSSICRAVGKLQVSDSEQLHHIPFIVTVKVKPAGPDRNGVMREAQNELRGYEAANGSVSAVSNPATRPSMPQHPQAANTSTKPATAPWRKQAAG